MKLIVNLDERYYTETEIDTKMLEIKTKLDSLIGFTAQIVTELPSTGETGVIYLILNESATENNIYDEYIYVNDAYELIGSTNVDLTGYVTQTVLDSRLGDIETILDNIVGV